MKRTDYVQSVVRTRLLEKELLSQVKFEQMIEATDINDLWRVLKTTHYAHYLQDRHYTKDEFEQFLMDALQLEYENMHEITLESSFIDCLQLKYDYFNCKVLCKEILLDEDLSHLAMPLSTLSYEELRDSYHHQQLAEHNHRLAKAIEKVLLDYESKQDPQRIEILLDRLYIEHLYDTVKALNLPLIMKYIQAKIDFTNIKTILRVQKQQRDMTFLENVLLPHGEIELEKLMYSLHDSPVQLLRKYEQETIGKSISRGLEQYEQTKSLSALEREMDEYLIRLIDDAKYIHFGPEPLMAYMIKKEAEIKNLRIIFISKRNNVSVSNINQRMRDVYV